jgi:hypothetical protein
MSPRLTGLNASTPMVWVTAGGEEPLSPRVWPSALLRLRRGHSPASPARGGEPRTRTSAGARESHPAQAVWKHLDEPVWPTQIPAPFVLAPSAQWNC